MWKMNIVLLPIKVISVKLEVPVASEEQMCAGTLSRGDTPGKRQVQCWSFLLVFGKQTVFFLVFLLQSSRPVFADNSTQFPSVVSSASLQCFRYALYRIPSLSSAFSSFYVLYSRPSTCLELYFLLLRVELLRFHLMSLRSCVLAVEFSWSLGWSWYPDWFTE